MSLMHIANNVQNTHKKQTFIHLVEAQENKTAALLVSHPLHIDFTHLVHSSTLSRNKHAQVDHSSKFSKV